MSIPYYSLQPGSQKNALTDDARCKYWVSAPPLAEFTGCNFSRVTACCNNGYYFQTKLGRKAGLYMCCNQRYTHSSGDHCCPAGVCGAKGCMGYQTNTVNVDQCYLTTYSITGPTSNIYMDEFGQTIDSSLRPRSAGSWEPPAACGYTYCGQPICGFNKCAREGGSCYLRLGGSCAGLNVHLCGNDSNLATVVDKKASRYPECNPFIFETGGMGCLGYATYCDIRPLYSIDELGPVFISSCVSNTPSCYGHQTGRLCTSVFGTDDPLKSHYMGCCNCCYFHYCLTITPISCTIQSIAMCQNIGTAWSINESTRRMHQWMASPCGACNCCYGSGTCCTRANVITAGYLLQHRIPTFDDLASCAICGDSRPGVECVIALPNTIFPQCRSAFDAERSACAPPMIGGNMYDCIFDEGRYTILNGTTLNARTRRDALMPYPILYDRCTSTVKTFEPFYECCHNWNSSDPAYCRWLNYQTNGFMALTSRNTLVHAWTCGMALGVKEMNLDGTPVTGACYTINDMWHCGARSTTAIDFMYDKNNDALIMSYMFGDCCCQCTNMNEITCGFTEPVVVKLPTNTCCINSVINESAWGNRCNNDSYRRMPLQLPTMCAYFFSGNCCSSFAGMDAGYCVRTCVIPDIRIFCATPGSCGGFITANCIKQRASCCTDGCHGRNALWIDKMCASINSCCYCCSAAQTKCSCCSHTRSQCEYSGRQNGATFGQTAWGDCYPNRKYRNEVTASGASQYFVNPLDLKTND